MTHELRGTVTPADVERHAKMLGDRVRKNYAHLRRRFERRGWGGFRLYDWDIPEVRAVVDWYEGHLIVGEYARAQTAGPLDWLGAMGQAVARVLGVDEARVHLKRRRSRSGQEARYERLGTRGERVQVREGDLKFWVNLDDFIDTGLFNDHRLTRLRVSEECREARFLNLYAYTGTFTCAAAKGAARATTTVDLSGNYLEWTRENLVLNGLALSRHELVRQEVSEFLTQARGSGRRFDVCYLDPPSFSTVGGPERGLDVLRDHPWLIDSALMLLGPSGVLYFSTNHQRFVPRLEHLAATAVEITRETVPEDYRNRRVHRCWRITRGLGPSPQG